MEQAATVAAAEERLREDFALLDDYRDKIEYIMDLGKRLPPLADELKTEGNKVRGCRESGVAARRGWSRRAGGCACAPTATPCWSAA